MRTYLIQRPEKGEIVPALDVFLPPCLGGLLPQHEGGDLLGLFLCRFVGEEQQLAGVLPLERYPALIYLSDLCRGKRRAS